MSRMNLGAVTAYADAVAAGYSGTREEFGKNQAKFAENAAAVAADLEESKKILNDARNAIQVKADEEITRVSYAAEEKKNEIGALGAVLYGEQSLTETERGRARMNIGASGAIIENESGEEIAVCDSARMPVVSLALYGRASQTVSTGAQLANLSDVAEFESDGMLWSCRKGIVSVAGRAGESAVAYPYPVSLTGRVGSFYVSGGRADVRVCVKVTVGGEERIYCEESFVLDGSEDSVMLYPEVVAGAAVDTSVAPMLCASVVAKPFESYTEGKSVPDPARPSALEGAGESGTVRVTVSGKNLFDISQVKPSSSVSVSAESGTLTVSVPSGGESVAAGEPCTLSDYAPRLRAGDIVTLSAETTGSARCIRLEDADVVWNFGDFKRVTEEMLSSRVLWYASGASSAATVGKVMIERGVSATEFSPYFDTGEEMVFSVGEGFLAIPTATGGNYTDPSGQRYVCDEIDLVRRKYIKRIGKKVFDGSESIGTTTAQISGYSVFRYSSMSGRAANTPVICSHYVYGGNESDYSTKRFNNVITYRNSAPQLLFITSTGVVPLNNTAAFVDFLASEYEKGTPVTVLYELADPIESDLDDAVTLAFEGARTDRGLSVVSNDGGAQMTLGYVADTKLYIDKRIAALVARE